MSNELVELQSQIIAIKKRMISENLSEKNKDQLRFEIQKINAQIAKIRG